MSTIQSIKRHSTALCLAFFLAACSGPAPISDGTPTPGTKSDLINVTASPTMSSSGPINSEIPLQAVASDEELEADSPKNNTSADTPSKD